MSISLFLFVALSVIKVASGGPYDPIYALCNTNKYSHFTSNEENLSTTLKTLISQGSPGFSTASSSSPFGVFQCRPDVSSADCHKCSLRATVRLLDECASAVGARVQMEHCSLRYEPYNFVSKMDASVIEVLINVNNATNPAAFYTNVKTLLSHLSVTATAGKGFGYGTGSKIYGMALCRKDISGADCGVCLSKAMKQLDKYATGRVGAQVYLDSCSLRYETYQFYSGS